MKSILLTLLAAAATLARAAATLALPFAITATAPGLLRQCHIQCIAPSVHDPQVSSCNCAAKWCPMPDMLPPLSWDEAWGYNATTDKCDFVPKAELIEECERVAQPCQDFHHYTWISDSCRCVHNSVVIIGTEIGDQAFNPS